MSDCRRFEKMTRRGDPQRWRELEAHAQTCAECRQRLDMWREIEQAAPTLKKTWESPDLWQRIESAIVRSSPSEAPPPAPARPRFAWLPLAAAAALFLVAMIGLQVFRPSLGERELLTARSYKDPLLTENALSDVERSEQRYVAAIDRLSRLAQPKLKEPATPLLVSYREKLLLLDGAIADLRTQLDQNRFNTHLRRELLAMYQEKQRTLEQVVGEVKS